MLIPVLIVSSLVHIYSIGYANPLKKLSFNFLKVGIRNVVVYGSTFFIHLIYYI
ncbi:MAG: hypothetical protein EOP34_10125 [Rickettsiales bacterium]|nr:MAG: hypothetical protein EOP34_10125 [Rickettsiales bacterium]